MSRFEALYAPMGDSAELRETSLEHLKRYLLPTEPLPALTRAHFETAVAAARQRLPGLAPQFMDRLGPILQLRQQVQQRIGAVAFPHSRAPDALVAHPTRAPAAIRAANPLAAELASLVSSRFLERIAMTGSPICRVS